MAGTGIMRLWPQPAVGSRLTITYVPMPPELTEGTDRPPAFWDTAVWDLSEWDDDRGAESSPNMLPVQFHFNTLLPGTVVQMLDKDQRIDQVQLWQGRYESGIEKMHTWFVNYAGVPNTVFDESSVDLVRYPDQYSRGYR